VSEGGAVPDDGVASVEKACNSPEKDALNESALPCDQLIDPSCSNSSPKSPDDEHGSELIMLTSSTIETTPVAQPAEPSSITTSCPNDPEITPENAEGAGELPNSPIKDELTSPSPPPRINGLTSRVPR